MFFIDGFDELNESILTQHKHCMFCRCLLETKYQVRINNCALKNKQEFTQLFDKYLNFRK